MKQFELGYESAARVCPEPTLASRLRVARSGGRRKVGHPSKGGELSARGGSACGGKSFRNKDFGSPPCPGFAGGYAEARRGTRLVLRSEGLLRRVASGGWVRRLKKKIFTSSLYIMKSTCLIIVLALGGCVAIPNSPTPRFYALQALDESYAGEKFNVPSSVIIGIGPVKIPEYQNRPQIVTQDAENLITFAQFDRWGEPLDIALSRLFFANLSVILPGATLEMSPWNLDITVKYQVIMDVVRLESRLDKNLSLTVQWSVIDQESKKILSIKKSEFIQPIEPHNYSGLVKTLSMECASLSGEIAKTLSLSATQSGKENTGMIPNQR